MKSFTPAIAAASPRSASRPVGQVRAVEARPHRALQVLAERGGGVADPPDGIVEAPLDRDPGSLAGPAGASRTAALPDRAEQLRFESVCLRPRTLDPRGVVPVLRLRQLGVQLRETRLVLRTGARVENLAGVARVHVVST